MNSFEIQNEFDANAERMRTSNQHAKASSSTGSSQFSSLIPPPAPPPPPPSLSTNSLSSQSRSKPQTDIKRHFDHSGVLINTINEDHRYAVFVSCIEIYNNYIYDLLDDSNSMSSDPMKYISLKKKKNLKII